MRANVGDRLLTHGRIVGQHDREGEIVEVLGSEGAPPFRVRFEDGHETVITPGPDSVVEHVAEERRSRS
jgi:hypothetical protein